MKEALQSPQYDISNLKTHGDDIFISANAEIRRPHLVTIGSHVAIDSGFYVTTAAEIGDYVHLGPYITIIGGAESKIKIGNFVSISAGCRIICGSDQFMGEGFTSVTVPLKYRDKTTLSTIIIEQFAGVASNVVIAPGVTIGEGSVVGACSYVSHDTEPWTVYYGMPAKPIKKRPSEKLKRFAKELGYK